MEKDDLEISNILNKLPKGTWELLDGTSKSQDNTPLVPVHPELITSIDDISLFIFKGHDTKGKDKWKLVTKDLL